MTGTPPPAHVDDAKAAKVSQQQVAAAGRQFTAETERRYQGQNQSLASAYARVDELERLTASNSAGDSIEFAMDGSIGRRGCDYVLPARLPPVVEKVETRRGGGRRQPAQGALRRPG